MKTPGAPEEFIVKAPRPEGLDDAWQPVKVLVVDDEPIVRKLLTQVLRSAGYAVVGEAADGRAALDMFRALRPSVVTLDVEMPVMGGFETLREILAVSPKTIVVMLTNRTEREVVAEIVRAGARDYIAKPIDRRVILAKLRKARGIEE